MNDGIYIDLTFDDVTVGNVPVTWVGEDLFRLDGSPFVEDAIYQDVIQVEKVSDGSYIFQKLLSRPAGKITAISCIKQFKSHPVLKSC